MDQLTMFLRLAVRNIWRSPRRSLLTIAAIAFGLFCLIIFQALKVGLHREMVASTVQVDAASLQVVAAGRGEGLTRLQPLRDPRQVVSLLAERSEAAAGMRLRAPGLLSSPAGSAAVVLTGVEPEHEAQVTLVAGRLVTGRYLEPRGGILLGSVLAESLGVTVGDEVTVLVQTLFGKPASRRLPVRGIYRTALASFDRSHVFLDLPTAQSLFDAADVATAVAVQVPPEHEAALAAWLRNRLPADRYRVATWQELAPDVTQLIDLNDGTMRLLVLIVFAIVALGIVNTMGMSVMERTTEFGVLAALGIRPLQVVVLVILESLALGVVAALAGSLAGVATCGYLASYGLDLTSVTSANPHFATSHVIKAHLVGADLLLANLVGMLTALLAGLVPAWRASRLVPAEALRRL
jgi:ABC-type lipoprotein release transport system permease subunit